MLLDQSYSLRIIGHRHPSETESTLYAVLVPGLVSSQVISTCYFPEIPRGMPDSGLRIHLMSR